MLTERNKEFTLLIVEDNETSLEFLNFIFKKLGFRILTANDSEKGLEIFRNNKVDIVISDISLPGYNGIELAKRMKSIKENIRIIFVTAHTDTKLLLKAIEMNVSNYVLKPIDKDFIIEIVNKHVEQMTLENDLKKQQDIVLKLSHAIQHSSSKIILLDSEFNISFMNKRYENFTGFSSKSKNISLNTLYDFSETNTSYFKNALDNRLEWRGEIKAYKSDGSNFWAFTSLTPLFDKNDFIGHVIIQQDVTNNKNTFDIILQDKVALEKLVFARTEELQSANNLLVAEIENRKIIENELIAAKKQAESLYMAKTMFLSKVSHELRTPLNGVIGMTTLLFDTILSEKQKRLLEIVKYSAHSLLNLINDLLDYSKIEFGKFEIVNKVFNLENMIDMTVVPLKLMAQQKKLQFDIIIDPELPPNLIGDGARIGQIISNLATNALKFTEHGKVTVELKKIFLLDNKVGLKGIISDTGIGISEENHKEIFGGFTQIEPTLTRKYGGAGLGLTITKEIIELLGGTISLESKIGQGSKFSFEIILGIPQFKIEKKDRNLHQTDKIEPIYGKRILVIEDSDINQELISNILSFNGCVYKIFANGYDAVEDYKLNDFDIVLIDIIMPEINGYETLKLLRDIKKKNKIPMVAVSALDSDNYNFARENSSDFDDWISKPYSQQEIIQTIIKHTIKEILPANLHYLKSQLNNNEDSYMKVLNYFIENSDKELEEIKEYYKKGESDKINYIVHRMKSELAHLGADEAVKYAGNLEKLTLNDKSENLDNELNEFINSVESVREYIIKTIKNN